MSAAWRINVKHASTGTLKAGFPKVLQNSYVTDWVVRLDGDSTDSGQFNSLEGRLTVDPQGANMNPFDGVQIEWSANGTFSDAQAIFCGCVETPINPENLHDFQDVTCGDWREYLAGCEVRLDYPEQDAARTALQLMQDLKDQGQIPCITVPTSIPDAGYTVGAVTGNFASAREILDQLASLFQQDNTDPEKKCIWGVDANWTFFFSVRTVSAIPISLQSGEAEADWQGRNNRDAVTRVRWVVPISGVDYGPGSLYAYSSALSKTVAYEPASRVTHLSSSPHPATRTIRKSANLLSFLKRSSLGTPFYVSNIDAPGPAQDGDESTYMVLGLAGGVGVNSEIRWDIQALTDPDRFVGVEILYTAQGTDGIPVRVGLQAFQGFDSVEQLNISPSLDLPLTSGMSASDARRIMVALPPTRRFTAGLGTWNMTLNLLAQSLSSSPMEVARIFDIKLLELDGAKLDAYATYFYRDPESVAGKITVPGLVLPKRQLDLTRTTGATSNGLNIDHIEFRAGMDGEYGMTIIQLGQPDDPDKVAYWASVKNGDSKAEITAVTAR